MTDDQLAQGLASRIDRVVVLHVDPSASSFIQYWRRVYGRHILRLAHNPVLEGIKTVQNKLAGSDLTIGRDVPNLRAELGTYAWDLSKDDVPVKEHDHYCDALRYAIMGSHRVGIRPVSLPSGL